ncbi:hypothetical protein V8E54_008980 [Elaphomyces granulatus]
MCMTEARWRCNKALPRPEPRNVISDAMWNICQAADIFFFQIAALIEFCYRSIPWDLAGISVTNMDRMIHVRIIALTLGMCVLYVPVCLRL